MTPIMTLGNNDDDLDEAVSVSSVKTTKFYDIDKHMPIISSRWPWVYAHPSAFVDMQSLWSNHKSTAKKFIVHGLGS